MGYLGFCLYSISKTIELVGMASPRVQGALWERLGIVPANRMHPTCEKVGKQGRGGVKDGRALLTDLGTGLLRLPRLHRL